jgi:hypothetical protein
LCDRFGAAYAKPWGWAASVIPPPIDLGKLENALNMSRMQPYFKMACYGNHAGSKGLRYDLGNALVPPGEETLLAGPSDAGFFDPGYQALGSYSYVSLFGISTLDDLKSALFANTVSSRDIGIEPGLDTLVSNTAAVAKKLSRRGVPVVEAILDKFRLKGPPGTTSFLEYFSINESVICIDDIERRGDKLAIRDVLGLISQLKEQKRCKVILILNDDAIAKDRENAEFAAHSEKVIDIHLRFAPTASESVAIALSTSAEHIRLLGEHCVTLRHREYQDYQKA